MGKYVYLVIFPTKKMADVVYREVRRLRPDWKYLGRELKIPTSIQPYIPIIFATELEYGQKAFAGYTVLFEINYKTYDSSPEELIKLLELNFEDKKEEKKNG